jgi:hypothetical protein
MFLKLPVETRLVISFEIALKKNKKFRFLLFETLAFLWGWVEALLMCVGINLWTGNSLIKKGLEYLIVDLKCLDGTSKAKTLHAYHSSTHVLTELEIEAHFATFRNGCLYSCNNTVEGLLFSVVANLPLKFLSRLYLKGQKVIILTTGQV